MAMRTRTKYERAKAKHRAAQATKVAKAEKPKISIKCELTYDGFTDGPVDLQTVGMEAYGLKNLYMRVPDGDYFDFGYGFLKSLAQSMIDGEQYNLETFHAIDEYEGAPLDHFFFLTEDGLLEDEYDGIQVAYGFGIPAVYNGITYMFNRETLEWDEIEEEFVEFIPTGRYCYNPFVGVYMPEDEYDEFMAELFDDEEDDLFD